jgi:hypothetical protein
VLRRPPTRRPIVGGGVLDEGDRRGGHVPLAGSTLPTFSVAGAADVAAMAIPFLVP